MKYKRNINYDPGFLTSEQVENLQNHIKDFLEVFTKGIADPKAKEIAIRNQTENRYLNALKFVVPWVDKGFGLSGKRLLEIGCGSGTSTSAFAHFVKSIVACDIDPVSIEGAKLRADYFSQKNIDFHLQNPVDLIEVAGKFAKDTDIVLLFAVLEHMTIQERIAMLSTLWSKLPYGSVIVIAGTPNRLSYWDAHTSWLPFFHLLPSDLRLLYVDRSPRKPFQNAIMNSMSTSIEDAKLKMVRWGLGVSFHEFQIAFGDDNLHHHLLCDGYEEDICRWYGNIIEQRLLQTYFIEKDIDIPIGFSRSVLNLIFKKTEHGVSKKIQLKDRKRRIFNYEEKVKKLKNNVK